MLDFHTGLLIGGDGKAEALGALNQLGADVAGHDEKCVAEIDAAPLGVGEGAVLHNLEEHIECFGVGFFDFVEEHDRVGAAADGLGELPAFFVADVSGRGADEAAYVVPLHELAHIEFDEGFFAAEEEFGEDFGQFRFADSGWSQKDEAADGALGSLRPARARRTGLADGLDWFVLTDDAFV